MRPDFRPAARPRSRSIRSAGSSVEACTLKPGSCRRRNDTCSPVRRRSSAAVRSSMLNPAQSQAIGSGASTGTIVSRTSPPSSGTIQVGSCVCSASSSSRGNAKAAPGWAGPPGVGGDRAVERDEHEHVGADPPPMVLEHGTSRSRDRPWPPRSSARSHPRAGAWRRRAAGCARRAGARRGCRPGGAPHRSRSARPRARRPRRPAG